MHLFKLFQNAPSQAAQALPDASTGNPSPPEQPLILEPILTPSGLPLDVEIENDTIATDRVELLTFDDADSDLDQPPDSDPIESEGDVLGKAAPLPGEDGDWGASGFFNPEVIGFESGMFIVGDTGEVTIDYLFDGGGYKGELAIFSLDGMDLPGTDDFVQEDFMREAASRALSNSDQGHIAISDRAEGARFSGELGETDKNSGDYLGAKTFKMRPGDEIGFMLVPNGRVQEVLDNPAIGGAKTPLFSLSTANPDGMFHAGQIADVFGDGQTFVFEDLRTDGTSDLDYNDVVFQVRGAKGQAKLLSDVIAPGEDWRATDMGEAIRAYASQYIEQEDGLEFVPWEGEEASVSDIFANPIQFEFPVESQPLVGLIDTGFSADNPYIDYSKISFGTDWVDGDNLPLLQSGEGNEHGTHVLGLIAAERGNDGGFDGINDSAPIWLGRAIGSGKWADSLVEFVDAAKASGQPNAVVNLSFDLGQLYPDGSQTARYEFTPTEWEALKYAEANNVLVVAAAGNDEGVMSALGQASRQLSNLLTVGAAEGQDTLASTAKGFDRAEYSNYGNALDLLAYGGTEDDPVLSATGTGLGLMAGTSVAAAQVTGAASLVWAANPDLTYAQVMEILKKTATDLTTPNWDLKTGAGLLNIPAAVHLAKATQSQPLEATPSDTPDTWWRGTNQPVERAVAFQYEGRTYEWEPYTVKPGDSLSAIAVARMGGGSWPNIEQKARFIAQKNGIPNIHLIYPGQVIQVPRQVTAPPTSVTINGFTIGGVFYPVWQAYKGTIGNPISNVISHYTGARYQLFQRGSIVNSQFGTFPLYGGIRQTYLNNGGLNGWLGAPTSAEHSWNGKIRQTFAKGYIVWDGRRATAYRNGSSTPPRPTPSPRPTPTPAPQSWYHPVPGARVSSEYGWRTLRGVRKFHYGIDLAASTGTPVKAARSGKVIYAGWNTQGYGNLVIIQHDNGIRSYYAHLSSVSVGVGAQISGGSQIGRVGSTGNSTGPHLHLEIRVAPYRWQTNNRNPRNYIRF